MSQGRKKAPEGASKTNHTQDSIKYAVLSRLTKKPQSRYDIADICHTNERVVRKAVEELRLEGYPVCISSTGKGYWLGTPDECKRTAKELESRAYKLLRTARALRGINPDQIGMEELL